MKKNMKYNLAMAAVFFSLILATCEPSQAYDANEDVYCLAKNIYFEAGNQPLAGRIAVGNVTINRKNHKMFPNNICDVV